MIRDVCAPQGMDFGVIPTNLCPPIYLCKRDIYCTHKYIFNILIYKYFPMLMSTYCTSQNCHLPLHGPYSQSKIRHM